MSYCPDIAKMETVKESDPRKLKHYKINNHAPDVYISIGICSYDA